MLDNTLRFPRTVRLLHSSDYQRVFSDPMKSADRWLTILARPNTFGYARLGLAISKKHVKFAVQRNRLKRLARESFRLHITLLGSMDVVVMARHGAADASNDQLFVAFMRHWQRLQSCARSSSS